MKLVVCIPTYERSECIARVLEEELEIFIKHNIDICIYDSSIRTETEEIVRAYIDRGYYNLSYKKMDDKIHANHKGYQIFEEIGQTDYDYVWMIHDHTICNSEDAISDILSALENRFDFYLLNMQGSKKYLKEITSLDEFLLVGAWPLNSFGACILNVKTFVRGTDWVEISKNYLKSKTINYSHLGFYFERAAEIENFKACKLELHREGFLDFLRNQKTSWDRETIRICTECWGSVISGLPDIYTTKAEAMKTQDRWFLAAHKLIFYKKNGQFGIKSFLRYGTWFKKIFPETFRQKMFIAIMPFFISKYVYSHTIVRNIKRANKREQKVYVFGAGRHAAECAQFLNKINLTYEGFLVTNKNGNPVQLLSHPVYEISKYADNAKIFIIVAVQTSAVQEVRMYLDKAKENNKYLGYMIFDK
uniref:glycosyltransferase n=1 Tax=Agathobacter sp. TaxID=2021311 RepID=UPI004056696C